MIVYCKKDYFIFLKFGDERYYYKYKIYQASDFANYCIFVYTDIKNGEGLWFSNDEFNELFTFDKNFVRQEKLNRICNEEGVL